MEDQRDKILRIYSRLISLKDNLPDRISIDQKYICEFHVLIDELSKVTESDLEEFKIPASEIAPILTSSNYITGEKNYSKESYCEKSFLLSKLDALIGYFSMKYISQDKTSIGFTGN